ncbi:MAG: hypothetical protein ACYC1U_06075 [Candidatus Aquicultorales bacterium]
MSKNAYYAIAGLIAAIAVLAVGLWVFNGQIDFRTTKAETATESANTKTTKQPADSNSDVTASDEDIERLSQEAEEELAGIESILAEIDRIEVQEDAGIDDIGL